MRKDISNQLDLLKSHIDNLWNSSVLLNFLHTRTDLERIEPCEMERALKGIETSLNIAITEAERRIAFILGEEVNND
ncbi:hypothetical protein [Rodentibacter caecimuris]|uniref:Uncharacterized protein n=1 Tax=Rodentibacter caecimuris TaxID=1796644 RepID=A0ABX3KW26_9PAST|nr:hypothetical protein BKG89_09325 [Rodentibacter heylii]